MTDSAGACKKEVHESLDINIQECLHAVTLKTGTLEASSRPPDAELTAPKDAERSGSLWIASRIPWRS